MSIEMVRQLDRDFIESNDTRLARESSHRLAQLLGGIGKHSAQGSDRAGSVEIEVRFDGEHEIVALPPSVLHLLNEILIQMAQGNAVQILPTRCELTTVQAAELLNVSRPYLIGLLEKGEIPYHKTGTHRRILLEDVQRYKQVTDEKRMESLRELSELSEELGLDN